MRAVLLAGGLRCASEQAWAGLPRPFWPLPSEPLIGQALRFVTQAGLNQVIIAAHGLSRGHFDALPGSFELHLEDRPRGPAGALKDLESQLGQETFLVLQSTGHYRFNLAEFLAAHRAAKAQVTVGAISNASGRLEPAGVYLMEPQVLQAIAPVGYQDLKEQLIPRLEQSGAHIQAVNLARHVHLIHGPEDYFSLLPWAMAQSAGPLGLERIGPQAYKHPSAQVHSSARLLGPVWIDRNSQIHAQSLLLGPVLVGPDVQIGPGSLLHRAVAWGQNRLNEGSQLQNHFLAPGRSLPATAPYHRPPGRQSPSEPSRWRALYESLLGLWPRPSIPGSLT